MAFILIKHDVKSFENWKPFYDEHEGVRRKAGLKELYLLRGADNPNEVVLLFEASDLAKAKEFINSAELKIIMEKAGVIGEPTFSILEKAALRKAA